MDAVTLRTLNVQKLPAGLTSQERLEDCEVENVHLKQKLELSSEDGSDIYRWHQTQNSLNVSRVYDREFARRQVCEHASPRACRSQSSRMSYYA